MVLSIGKVHSFSVGGQSMGDDGTVLDMIFSSNQFALRIVRVL